MLSWAAPSYAVIATYSLLYLSVLFLWLPTIRRLKAWWISAFLSIIFGLISGQITVFGVAILAVFAFLLIRFKNSNVHYLIRTFLGGLIFVLSIGLATHSLPGFNNLNIIDKLYISSDGVPYTLYLNIDKTFMGLLIIGLSHPLISKKQLIPTIKNTLPLTALTILVTMLMAFALGYIHFDPKLPNEFLVWGVTNLLFVCLAEEALFRGFIQRNLTLIFHHFKYEKYASVISIFISASLFGLAHYAGGWKYILLATIAGIGYGTVYNKTQRIESSMMTRFLLNTLHFLFFTYPALAII